MKKRIRGVIVWDFDGVLFDAKKFRLDSRSIWVGKGVPEKIILEIIEEIHRKKKHFSVSEFIRGLHKKRYHFSEKFVQDVFHHHLVKNSYYAPETDRLLHRMRKKGFLQMILSMGSAPFQYKKIKVGCGRAFTKHFFKLVVTSGPKYPILLRIRRKCPDLPLIFVDDTKEHLILAKKHVPGIKTIYYSNVSKESLRDLERRILLHARKS